jgi:hypothetical protein
VFQAPRQATRCAKNETMTRLEYSPCTCTITYAISTP